MRNQVFKKLFSVLLALIMVAGLLPASVLAEGEGNAETTPAPTETVQLTESAEPTKPAETETPEVTEVPESTPENPATTQGEPTAEPTDEGIMPANVMPVQAATENNTAFTVDETKALERESVSNVNYRAVMLDCGRKYFSVENIKKLIDTMAQYGYNQLQLSFGNGGCRFLLDDMSLSFKNVTMASDTVKTNITNGNYSFNGDKQYLSQTDMDAIITYAKEKGIEIVPMLNMPGHATAIVYNTNYSSNGNLIINNETSRYYGYALLKKYAEYFAGKGCKYFSFGADESGYTGDNMTAFLTGCANVIVKAGMIPRAFNDATNVATMPTSVQITYWHKESGSQSASALASSYEMINTHGRWYYVIKTAQNSEKDTKYWQGTVRTTETSVELPVMKAENMDKRWVGINEFFDNDYSTGSTIESNKGTMFCIWCDASQDTYLTDSDVISENENYGALYQLQKLAEHYWPEDIKKTTAPVVTTKSGAAVPTTMTAKSSITLTASESVAWTTSNASVIKLTSDASVIKLISATNADGDTITGSTVTAVAVGAGEATIRATNNAGETASYTINVQDAAAATTKNVSLKVGDTSDPYTVTGNVTEGEQITDDNKHIAMAKVEKVEAVTETTVSTVKATKLEDGASYILRVYNTSYALTTNTGKTDWNTRTLAFETYTAAEDDNVWTLEKSGEDGYKLKSKAGYLNLGTGNNTAWTDTTGEVFTLASTTTGWTIKNPNNEYINALGGIENLTAGGWTGDGTRFDLYKVTEATEASTTLTITGTGEGETEVKVGDTTYKITVTAPEKTETVTVAPRSSVTLNPTIPTGGTVTYTLEDGNNEAGVTLAETGVVTTGEKTGNAIVKAVVKNAGEKVVAYYTYTITVSDIDWNGVDPLPVELWITNTTVGVAAADNITTADRNGKQVWTVNVSAQSAYKEEGVLLGSLVPYNGYKSDNDKVKTVYWKGTVQTTVPQPEGNDLSYAGTDFTRVRYWNNAWQYQVNDNWQNFDLATNSNNTVVAFYLQISDVSPEITTGTQHYGNPPTNNPGSNSGNGYTMTTFAVVYPDGTLSRTEQQMYEKGMIRGFWGGTSINIGTVYAENNSTYKVSKITVTWGNNILGSSGSNWYTVGKTGAYGTNWGVKWDKVTNSAGDEWYAETTYWEDGDSERPMVDGNALNLNLTTEKNAVLILIYLEVVQTEDTLSIVYWDDNGNKQITTNPMPIPVVVNSDVTFSNGIQQTSPVNIGMFTLDDDAYILNSSGAKQGFNKNLSTVPGVTGVYMSGMYQYVSAEISGDGKTLTLHFNLKSATKEKTYVVDFGLPLVVTAAEFEIENTTSIDSMSLEKNKITMAAQGNYGRATIANDFSNVTYELNKMLNGKATIPLYVTFNDGTSMEFQVHIIPATSVYYEDSFATFTDGSGAAVDATWAPVYDPGTDANTNATQALEALGEKTNHNVYGYDPAYDKCTMFSMGSARKVTVTSDMAKTGVVWPTAQFTFKGTGFDIISLTDNTSGAIFVDVYKGNSNSGEKEKGHVVNNYYGYTYSKENGWEIDNNPNAIYQVPVIKVSGLTYGEHTVVIKVCYDKIFDVADGKKYSFWLDAVRVYDPAGNTLDNDYVKDSEVKPIYVEVRKAIIGQNGFTADTNVLANGAVFIDGKSTGATLEDYKNFGPNHEVYLAGNQAIAFRIVADREPATVQIGVKLANGSSGELKLSGSNAKFAAYGVADENVNLTLNTATDMYYALNGINWTVENGSQKSDVIVLTNTGENSIVSITNVKCTYVNAEESTANTVALAISYDDALMAVDMVNNAITPIEPEPEPEPEPEKTFEPERFEANWSRNVIQGRKATLTVKTSEDVEAITVDGQTIRSYRTRTERVGFGRRAKRITYREFTYSMVAQESADFSVTAINAEGTESEAITARLTVKTRPNSMRDMWDWFKGWF